MTKMKVALVFCIHLCILQLANGTNGEITPPWITYRGCYEWTPGYRSTQLTDNSPTNCFKNCANLTHIGIRADLCICFENMPTTLRKKEIFCHSGQPIHIYSKVIELPFNISQADYGYVYVSIQNVHSSMIFHASIDSSENHGLICIQDYSWNCAFRKGAANNVNGETAKSRCSLVSYFDLKNSCQWEDGDYWIEMFRETPMESSTNTSTNTSTFVLPSTQQMSYVSENTRETFSQTDSIIRSTIKLRPPPITLTSSGFHLTDVTTSLQYPASASLKGEPGDIWKKMAISFITISLALTIFIISGTAAFLRWKKRTHIRQADGENNLIESTGSSHTKKGKQTSEDEDNADGTERHESKGNIRHQRQVTLPALLVPSKREGGTSDIHETTIGQGRNGFDKCYYKHSDQIPDVFKTTKHKNVDGEGHNSERPTNERKHNETNGTNISDTAVKHSLLENAEYTNANETIERKKKKKKKKKKKSKNKKSKRNHTNSTDAIDRIHVS